MPKQSNPEPSGLRIVIEETPQGWKVTNEETGKVKTFTHHLHLTAYLGSYISKYVQLSKE